jgi:hypothetical protein
LILLPLTLLMTLAQWVPTLAGSGCPWDAYRLKEPASDASRAVIPDLRYLVEDCEIARVDNATLSHPSRWKLISARWISTPPV